MIIINNKNNRIINPVKFTIIEQDKELSRIKKNNDKRKQKELEKQKLYNNIINDNYVKSQIARSHKSKSIVCTLSYPHMAIGSFGKAFRDYIHYEVYDQFKEIIFGSYHKSIQSYLQQLRYNENDSQQLIDIGLPIFNYTMEIEGPDEKMDTTWRNTSWFPLLSNSIYSSFYSDDDFDLKLVYRRMKGTISSNIYCNSHAEAIDIQMAFLNGFRGLNHYNQTSIRSMTILSDQIFIIDVDGKRTSKILNNNKITKSFIPDINASKYYIYNNIPCIINMQSITHSHTYYGGQAFPEYSLQASFNFELEVPNYILCLAKSNIQTIELNIDIAYKNNNSKVINAIKNITGKELLDYDLDKNKMESTEINTFEKGSFIDKKIIIINNENMLKLPCYSLFNTKQWHFKNEDILILLIYSGGCIRIPIDKEVAEFDNEGNIIMKKDLFNIDDLVEIYVFKYNDFYFNKIKNKRDDILGNDSKNDINT